MNRVILMGRLTRDPDFRQAATQEGTSVARYSLAVDRPKREGQEPQTDFISCVAFGRSAEFANKYLQKGTKMLIEGRIQTGSYTNKDGVKVYTTDVVIEHQEFAESKKNESGTQAAPEDEFMTIPEGIDEEVPFN